MSTTRHSPISVLSSSPEDLQNSYSSPFCNSLSVIPADLTFQEALQESSLNRNMSCKVQYHPPLLPPTLPQTFNCKQPCNWIVDKLRRRYVWVHWSLRLDHFFLEIVVVKFQIWLRFQSAICLLRGWLLYPCSFHWNYGLGFFTNYLASSSPPHAITLYLFQ